VTGTLVPVTCNLPGFAELPKFNFKEKLRGDFQSLLFFFLQKYEVDKSHR